MKLAVIHRLKIIPFPYVIIILSGGTFSNGKTAVANNEQIVKGIENGVYNAVMSAMSNNNSGSSYISNEIIVDGEVIARSITKAQEKRNSRGEVRNM